MNPYLRANLIEFPGRAGDLQRDAAGTDLFVQELGENYGHYHRFLRAKLEEIGGDPDPAKFRGEKAETADDADGYARQADTFQRVLTSEMLLRQARAHRRDGRSISDPLTDHPPLIDSDRALVDVEHPERARFTRPPAYLRLAEKPRLPG